MPDSVAMKDFDAKYFGEIKGEADQMEADQGKLHSMMKELEQMVAMSQLDDIPTSQEDIKTTLSPDVANKTWGASRLLTTTEPTFSLPYDQNDRSAQGISSRMEKLAKLMWVASGRINGGPNEIDAVMSALVHGQVHGAVRSTTIALELASDAKPWEKERIERIHDQTPYLFDFWSARQGFYLRDRYGMVAYERKYKQKARQLKGDWPGVNFDYKGNEEVIVRDWYDHEYHIVWIDGTDRPFFMVKHGLGFIPIVVQTVEGSRIFEKPEEQVHPFLYNVWKSGLHKRQTLAMTALYTAIFSISTFGTWKHTAPGNNPTKELQVAERGAQRIVELEPGEQLEAMLSKGAIDPQLIEAFQLAERKIGESTIYDQALGQPLGSNAAFSMVALLHQAGRLPLANPQRLTGWAISSLMDMAFLWAKKLNEDDAKAELKASYLGDTATVKIIEVPDQFAFDARLDVDLPQDNVQQANAAAQLAGGDNPMTSKRWVREQVLNIGDSEAMDEEIWSERAGSFFFQQMMQKIAEAQQQAAMQAQQQAAMQAQAAAANQQGGGGGAGNETRGGLTREQQNQPGQPMVEPLPPQGRGNGAGA